MSARMLLYVDASAKAGEAFRAEHGDGYGVVTARSAEDAAWVVRDAALAIVTLGPKGGPLDGLACAKLLSRYTRVLLLSAHARDYTEAALLGAGATAFLALPAEPRELEATIARLASDPRARRERAVKNDDGPRVSPEAALSKH